jgi:hypothetical protein
VGPLGQNLQKPHILRRACAALVLLCAFGAAPAPAAEVSTSSPLWSGLRAVGVQCLVRSSSKLDAETLGASLCERVRAIVAKDSPVPVTRVNPGDPAIHSAGTVTLLVHASVEPVGDRLALSFAIRPIRPSSRYSEVYSATAPTRADLDRDTGLGPSLDSPLTSALAELLPWKLQRPEIRVLTEIH